METPAGIASTPEDDISRGKNHCNIGSTPEKDIKKPTKLNHQREQELVKEKIIILYIIYNLIYMYILIHSIIIIYILDSSKKDKDIITPLTSQESKTAI